MDAYLWPLSNKKAHIASQFEKIPSALFIHAVFHSLQPKSAGSDTVLNSIGFKQQQKVGHWISASEHDRAKGNGLTPSQVNN